MTLRDDIFKAVQQDDTKRLRALLLANPQEAVASDNVPLLSALLETDNISCAETLLELLTDPAFRAQLKPAGNIEFFHGDPLYAHPKSGSPAHFTVRSVEAVELLARHGYDMNLPYKGHNILSHLLSQYREQGRFSESGLEEKIQESRKMIKAAIASGVSPHLPLTPGTHPADRIGDFAKGLLTYWAMQERKSTILPAFEARKLTFLAERGIDVGSAMDLAPFEQLPKNAGVGDDEVKRRIERLHKIAGPVQNLCRNAPSDFIAAEPGAKRARCARIACAGGTFPLLLERLAKTQRYRALEEAETYLDDHWRARYRHSLGIARAAASREGPVTQSALAQWVRG